jgi:hypothetical protein
MIALNPILTALAGSLGNTSTDDTSKGSQIGATRLEKYNTQAEELLLEYDTNNNNSLSFAEASPLIKDKMTGTLNAERLQQVFEALALRGMSQVELSRTLQLADDNEDGTVSSAELKAFGDTLKTKLTNGQDPEKLYAQLSAKALKAGGAESTGAELTTLKTLFEKYDIPKSAYTPTEGDTDTTEGTDWRELLKKFGPGLLGLIQNRGRGGGGGGGSSPASSPSVDALSKMPSLPLPSLASMSGGLPGMPPLGMPLPSNPLYGMTDLSGLPMQGSTSPFLGSSPPLLGSSPLGLGTTSLLNPNAFGGPSTLNPLLAGSAGLPNAFNPLLAGSNNLNLLPQQPFAQTNFVPSVPVAPSGFAFTPAPPVATVGTAPALPTPVVATTPAANPAVTSWAPPTPTLLAQALPQAPAPTTANGGW